jgi:hypothetical protein
MASKEKNGPTKPEIPVSNFEGKNITKTNMSNKTENKQNSTIPLCFAQIASKCQFKCKVSCEKMTVAVNKTVIAVNNTVIALNNTVVVVNETMGAVNKTTVAMNKIV